LKPGSADAGRDRGTPALRNDVQSVVAYQGEIELLNAKWELSSGRTVEFRLVETAENEDIINPFKEHQKRRGNRVGQRFHVCVTAIDTAAIVYDSEVQLCGWAHTERGKTVKLWLDEESSTHPFAGYEKRADTKPGSMFVCVFVLLDDDQSPVNLQMEKKLLKTPKPRSLSNQIHLMITSPLFCRFMTERSKRTEAIRKNGLEWHSIYNGEMMTKAYIKSFLKLESLSDLDRDELH
jgi:hypothetical protein